MAANVPTMSRQSLRKSSLANKQEIPAAGGGRLIPRCAALEHEAVAETSRVVLGERGIGALAATLESRRPAPGQHCGPRNAGVVPEL
jgi:hypothetical protein